MNIPQGETVGFILENQISLYIKITVSNYIAILLIRYLVHKVSTTVFLQKTYLLILLSYFLSKYFKEAIILTQIDILQPIFNK